MKGNHQTTKRKMNKEETQNKLENNVYNDNSYILSIITLNVNELNATIKIIEWQTGLKKQEPMI